MAMTKKHFIALAAEIRDLDIPKTNKAKVAQAVARVCKRDNANFSFDTFYSAVGVDPREKPRVRKMKVVA